MTDGHRSPRGREVRFQKRSTVRDIFLCFTLLFHFSFLYTSSSLSLPRPHILSHLYSPPPPSPFSSLPSPLLPPFLSPPSLYPPSLPLISSSPPSSPLSPLRCSAHTHPSHTTDPPLKPTPTNTYGRARTLLPLPL